MHAPPWWRMCVTLGPGNGYLNALGVARRSDIGRRTSRYFTAGWNVPSRRAYTGSRRARGACYDRPPFERFSSQRLTHDAGVPVGGSSPVWRLRTGSPVGRAVEGGRPDQPAGTRPPGPHAASGTSWRPGHARRAPSAALAERQVRRFRSWPERRHQSPARDIGRFGRVATLYRDAAPARVPIRGPG